MTSSRHRPSSTSFHRYHYLVLQTLQLALVFREIFLSSEELLETKEKGRKVAW